MDRELQLRWCRATLDGPLGNGRAAAADQVLCLLFSHASHGPNRNGIGAVVRVESASGRQWSHVRSGSSYCSQNDLALIFGLGKDPMVTALEIDWPSGTRQRLTNVRPNQHLVIEESRGIVPSTTSSK